MADNTTLNLGTGGNVFGDDDIAGIHYQRIKLIHGADGVSAGDVSTTNGLPVDMRYVGGVAINATPAGFQRVSDEPTQIFYDPFESLDTTDRWTATAAGGGVTAAVTNGRMTVGSGVTVNGYAYITSKPTFMPTVPGWLGDSFLLKLESAVGINAVRFYGLGIVSGSVPSSTNPLGTTGNGIGFEVDIAGVLNAVLYSNGTRTVINALASNQPADALDHRYIIIYRTDRTDFYIDGLGAAQLVATTTTSQSPAIQVLSTLILAVAHSVAPAASRVLDCAGLAVWDTAKNNRTQSDGVFGWRKQTIKAPSTAALATDLPAVIALHPTSPVPAGANLIGKVGIDQTTPGSTNNVTLTSQTVSGQLTASGSITITDLRGAATVTLEGIATAMTTHTAGIEVLTLSGVWELAKWIYTTGAAGSIGVPSTLGTLTTALSTFSVRAIVDVAGYAGCRFRASSFTGTSFDITMVTSYAPTSRIGPDFDPLLASAKSVNNAQVNGVTVLTGNGVAGTGAQRVTIASDNTAFPVNATLQTGANTIGAVTGPAAAALSLDATQTNHTQTFKSITPITTLSAVNTTITLTLTAAGAGLFHYITRIRITMHNTSAAAVVGSAVTLAYTSTNIPGALAWTEGNALAAGASKTVVDEILDNAIKTTTANTATTIVAPACGTGVLVRITAYYYTAA